MRVRASPVIAAIFAASLAPLMPRVAHAQPSSAENIKKGEALVEEAQEAINKNDYATACPKLEEAVRLVPEGVGAKIALADCYEADGRLTSAWKSYMVAEAAAASAGQADRQKAAHEHAAALLPRLSKVVLVVPDATRSLPGLEVRSDGMLVEPKLWGVPIPVDHGQHRIEATATGKKNWEKTVEVQAGDAHEVSIEIGPFVDAKPASVEVSPARMPPSKRIPPSETMVTTSWSTQKKVGLIVGAGGLAGLVAGSIFDLRALSKKNESNADGHCDGNNLCDATGVTLRDEARTAGTVSTVLFVAGGALTAGGIVLFVAALSGPAAAHAEVRLGPLGIGFRGRW